MKKDLAYVCNHFKALVIPHTPDDFTVAEPFRHGLTNDELRKGITAFREFLTMMFETIAERKESIDVKRGSKYDPYGTKGDRGTSSIKERFPVFYDLTIILLSLGFHGRLEAKPEMKLAVRGEDMSIIIDPITEQYQSVIRMSGDRKLEMFRLLSDLGLRFDGADFSEEVDFSKTGTFHITSAKNDYFAVGLKLIADAMTNIKEHYKLENLFRSVFLRGDFSPLANATPKKYNSKIEEYANAQLPEIREWIIMLDSFLTKNGCKLIQGMGGGSPFTYSKRNTTITQGLVCILNMEITGCFITPGVNHLANPNSIIRSLPDKLVNMVKSGEETERFSIGQCHRRMGFARFSFTHNGKEYEGCRHAGLRCQFSGVKCRFTGFSFDLAEPDVRELMRRWIEMELET
ncbi:MAG: hypothetical protein LBI19_06440 [Oscillospiraceae bacterium]|jgi:hypothetical protein|nr:hypothetical protein [Oscillospiraceae bacterium]